MKTTLRCTETDDTLTVNLDALKSEIRAYIESLTESETITALKIRKSGNQLTATYRFDGELNTLHFSEEA